MEKSEQQDAPVAPGSASGEAPPAPLMKSFPKTPSASREASLPKTSSVVASRLQLRLLRFSTLSHHAPLPPSQSVHQALCPRLAIFTGASDWTR